MPDIYLYSGATNPNDIILREPTVLDTGVTTSGDPGGYREAIRRYEADQYERQLERRAATLRTLQQTVKREERQDLVQQVDELVQYLVQSRPQTVETVEIDRRIDWLAGAIEQAGRIEFEQLVAQVAETARLIALQDDEDAITAVLLLS